MTDQGRNPLDERPTVDQGETTSVSIRDAAASDVSVALQNDREIYGPEAVGQYLRDVRMRRGITARDVSNQIRIRPNQVEALEDGRVEDLPGVVYCIGYVRAYANLLGLDGEEAVRRFKEAGPIHQTTELGFPEKTKPESRLPKPVLVLGALAVAAIAYGGWVVYDTQPQILRVAAVPDHLQEKLDQASEPANQGLSSGGASPEVPQVVEPAPQVTEDIVSVQSPETQLETQAEPEPEVLVEQEEQSVETELPAVTVVTEIPNASSIDSVSEQASVALEESTAAVDASTPESSTVLDAVETAETPTLEDVASAIDGQQLGQQTDSRITIKAESDSYVQVKDNENTLYLQRVLRAGDVYHVPDQPGLEMVVSNAGGVLVLLDGTALPPLGADKQIMQGIDLSPDGLRQTVAN